MSRRFTMKKEIMAVVRYYQTIYIIEDRKGERIYTGDDKKFAERILRTLNAYSQRKDRKKKKAKIEKRLVLRHRK